MKNVIFILLTALFFSCSNDKDHRYEELSEDVKELLDESEKAYSRRQENLDKLSDIILMEMEKAYFEGQKDAIEGDIRIKIGPDSINYQWSKSPWDDGSVPSFDPYKTLPVKIEL